MFAQRSVGAELCKQAGGALLGLVLRNTLLGNTGKCIIKPGNVAFGKSVGIALFEALIIANLFAKGIRCGKHDNGEQSNSNRFVKLHDDLKFRQLRDNARKPIIKIWHENGAKLTIRPPLSVPQIETLDNKAITDFKPVLNKLWREWLQRRESNS